MTEVHKTLQVIHQSEELLVAESPPQFRTIKVTRPGNLNYMTFHLGFPYIQFYLSSGLDLHLSFSKKPVRNFRRDKICFPFLPNVYASGLKVCLAPELFGQSRRVEDGNFWPPLSLPNEKIIEDAVGAFWNSGFYYCISWYGIWAVPEAIRKTNLNFTTARLNPEIFYDDVIMQFRAWEEGSRKEGVDFISNIDWPYPMFKNLPRLLKSKKKFMSCFGWFRDRNMKHIAHRCHMGDR